MEFKITMRLSRKYHQLIGFKKAPDTPLRPHILAAFLPWGGFAGADRPAPSQRYDKPCDYFMSI